MSNDKERIEQLAQEARKEMVEVCGLWVSDMVAVKLCNLFLSAVHAERGKEAVGYGLFVDGKCLSIGQHPSSGHIGGKSYKSQPLFLAPQIPEGMANREMQLAEVLTTIKDEFYFAEIDAHHPEVHAIRKLKDTLFAKLKKIVAAAGVAP